MLYIITVLALLISQQDALSNSCTDAETLYCLIPVLLNNSEDCCLLDCNAIDQYMVVNILKELLPPFHNKISLPSPFFQSEDEERVPETMVTTYTLANHRKLQF
jgi:hypothetical protein